MYYDLRRVEIFGALFVPTFISLFVALIYLIDLVGKMVVFGVALGILGRLFTDIEIEGFLLGFGRLFIVPLLTSPPGLRSRPWITCSFAWRLRRLSIRLSFCRQLNFLVEIQHRNLLHGVAPPISL